jgi:hypothetical protein
MRKILSIIIICIIASGSCLVAGQSSDVTYAAEDSNGIEIAADVLTVSVGYAGLEFTVRKTYTIADLKALGEVQAKYTWIDRMPAPCLNLAKGAKLLDILKDSGIDAASISRIHFTCSDAHETEELTSPYLFDQTKYYYPYLFEFWNYDTQSAEFGAGDDPQIVDTIIAYEDVWQRITSPTDELKTWDDLIGGNRFRLIFGMTDTAKQTAFNSAKWIHSIEVTLAGAPPEEETDEEKDDQKDDLVGSEKGDKPDKEKKKDKDKDKSKDKDKKAKGKTDETGQSGSAAEDSGEDDGNGSAAEPKEELKLIPLDASGSSTDAGYQPWRIHELSEDAVAMNAPPPVGEGMGGPTAGVMGGFLLIGGTWQFIILRRSMIK